MTWIILGSVVFGIIIGRVGAFDLYIQHIDTLSIFALSLLLFGVGLDLGKNKEVWQRLGQLGWKIILLPFGIALGSLGGAGLISLAIDLPLNHALAVGAGFGWYTLSAVLLNQLVSVELGTIAFLSNVFRELLAVILIPLLALRIGGITAIAPGGATCMDTTLPIVAKAAGSEIALIAFISGVILSVLVPILVPLLISLGI